MKHVMIIGKVFFLALIVLFSTTNTNAQEKWDPGKKKVILITGTASGMGKAFAEKLKAEGHIVYGGDIQYEKNRRQLDSIGAHPLNMDVTKDEEVQAGVDKIIAEQGRIDILLNNAGYGLFAPIEEVAIQDAWKQFDVNMFGYARTVKAVLPYMRIQNQGRIINLTSMGGKIYTPLGGWYHATKHAIEGWSDCLRMELRKFNIDVVILEPGVINTNFYNVSSEITRSYLEGTAYSHMMEALANPNADEMGDLLASATQPEEIAEEVNKIVNAKRPKTRYVKGAMANMAIWYRETFGDRAFDDFMYHMVEPINNTSFHISTDGLSYLNEGFNIDASISSGLWRLGGHYTEKDFSWDDDIEEMRTGFGAYVGTWLVRDHWGLNAGLGFDYYDVELTAMEGDFMGQTIDAGNVYTPYLRFSWAKDLIKFGDSALFLEPGFRTGYSFGADEIQFATEEHNVNGFEFDPFVNAGIKLRL